MWPISWRACDRVGELYVCGPTPMVDAIKAAWAKAGRRPSDLWFEAFGSSGRFAPEAFRVRTPARPGDRRLTRRLDA